MAMMLIGISAFGGDIYLFQGHAEGPIVLDSALGSPQIVEWGTDAFFYNTGSSDAVVKLLGSYEGLSFTIAPQHSASLSSSLPPQTFEFIHATVPDSVAVENALFIGRVQATVPGSATAPIYSYGKVRLPVFTALAPANSPMVHLATFLGNAGDSPSHLNVWVYNGGEQVATARVVVRRQCDDSVVDESTVILLPKQSRVIGGLGAAFHGCQVPTSMMQWSGGSTYTIVTANQPSLSFVSVVGNTGIPKATVTVN